MRSIWKFSNLGSAMMICSPVLAIGFGWEAFFPVALTSILGGTILLMGQSLCTQMFVGQVTAELVQDLVFADKDRRDLVLGRLEKAEADWFLAELPRAKAELRSSRSRTPADLCTRGRWAWRIQYS